MFVILLTLLIVLACIYVHKVFLELSNDLYFSIILLMISHLIHVLLFSWVYFICIDNMMGNHNKQYLDLFYYSISTYTTLGVGDVYFTGVARITSGIQSLIGLIMIAWSASHIYLKIQKET